jgi:preprotein translocase subunit SecA
MKSMMTTLGLPDNEPIQNGIISKTIEGAQSKIEGFNFDIRKHVLDYDDVMNKQREAVYRLRNSILEGADFSERAKQMVEETVQDHIDQFAPKSEDVSKWDMESLKSWLKTNFGIEWTVALDDIPNQENLEDRIKESVAQGYAQRQAEIGADPFNEIQRSVFLSVLDSVWVENLTYLEQLRRGIFLRAYAQKDPLIEFQKEGFRLFESMMIRTRDTFLEYIFHISVKAAEASMEVKQPTQVTHKESVLDTSATPKAPGGVVPVPKAPAGNGVKAAQPTVEKLGRNDPCFCGSGKKYKKCHGA